MTKIETATPELQPKPTSHVLQPNDWVEIGVAGDSEALGLPHDIMGQQVIAKISVGRGLALVSEAQTYPPQTVYIMKVTDKDNEEYKGLLGRAQAEGERQAVDADYIVAATGLQTHYHDHESLTGVAFLTGLKHDPLKRVVVGRSGSVNWLGLGFNASKEGEKKWTPFADNRDVSPFIIADSNNGVSIINLAASSSSSMEIKAPDLKVIHQSTVTGETVTEKTGKKSRAYKVAKLISGMGLPKYNLIRQ